jgi:hypothetical protein
MDFMRRALRPLLVVLALLFLVEAWLWDHLAPLVARLVKVIAWDRLKARIARLVENLPPKATLLVFLIPFVLLLPFHLLELVLLAKHRWILAVVVAVLAKLFGVGVTAFVFDATRHKLLQIAWFKRMYDWLVRARDWAHAQVAPVKQRLRQYIWLLRPQRAGRFMRRLIRLRRRMQRA